MNILRATLVILLLVSYCNCDKSQDEYLYRKLLKGHVEQIESDHHSMIDTFEGKVQETRSTIWEDFSSIGNTAHGILTMLLIGLVIILITIMSAGFCWACAFLRKAVRSFEDKSCRTV